MEETNRHYCALSGISLTVDDYGCRLDVRFCTFCCSENELCDLKTLKTKVD